MRRFLLASLFLIVPAACSRSEPPKEEQKQVATAQPPAQHPEQQPPASQTPPQQLESERQAPTETTPAPVVRPRAKQQPARRAPKPAEETYTPPPASQETRSDERIEREPIVPPAPSRRGGSGAPADNSLDSGRVATAPASPAPPPKPATAVLPEGTVIDVRLSEHLSSATNQVGDTFDAILDRDLIVHGEMLAPKGSRVTGKVTDVAGSGKVKGLAHMTLALTALRVDEDRYPISTSTISVQAENTKARDAKTIGAGAAIGAAIGAIAGGKKGAAIGGAIGGGAGTAGVLATKGKEIEFQPEHKFSFRLERDVQMKIR
ncbi:MAG: hypothetical protein ACE15E_10885 [Acidobacteriota bacterium]